MYQTLLTTLENGILTITINRPDKLNALNKQVFTDLNTALDEIYTNKEIRSVIITGAGPKAFVAGADISEFNGLSHWKKVRLWQKEDRIFFSGSSVHLNLLLPV
jgi:enoyl-CoA hydratase